MDTSWFVEMSATGLLIDPWLEGSEVDYAPWFNTQWHRTPPLPYAELPAYDAVLITQKYADHCHEATLKRLQPAMVLAPASLKTKLSRWLPQARCSFFNEQHRQRHVKAITVTQLPSRRRLDPIYDAFIVSDGNQALCIANHGFGLDAEHDTQLEQLGPCDVLLSAFNRYQLPKLLGGVVTPGLDGLQTLVEALAPRVVIQSHDEDKHARGLIPKLARIKRFDPTTGAQLPWLQERYMDLSHYEAIRL